MEILPGDSISLRASIFGRIATLIKPILDNLHCETFFFFTPTRQVWPNWVKFHGEQDSPEDSTDFVIPLMDHGGSAIVSGTLTDYFGILVGVTSLSGISALPYRCYEHIYRNWFRDQNLITTPPLVFDDGPDVLADYPLRKRRKRKDYFTGAFHGPKNMRTLLLISAATRGSTLVV